MYIFKGTCIDGILFKNITEVLYNFFKTLYMNIDDKGIHSRVMTNDGMILFDIVMPADRFEDWESAHPLLFGINLMNFYNLISSVKKKDSIEFSIEEARPRELCFTIHPKEYKYVERNKFTIQDVQIVEISLPTGYDAEGIEVPYQRFHKMCKELNKITRELKIYGNRHFITFAGETAGIYGKEIPFPEPPTPEQLRVPLALDGTFDMEQFIKLSKIVSFGKPVKFFIKEDLPLLIQTDIGSLGTVSIFIKKRDE